MEDRYSNDVETSSRLEQHRAIPEPECDDRVCGRCGEAYGPNDSRAELYHPEGDRALVHAEPCAEELRSMGWEIA